MWRYARYLLPWERAPLYITFFATSRCPLRCRHCFYRGSLGRVEELGLEEVRALASSLRRPINVLVTGGEPFVRTDLAEVLGAFHELSRAQVITVATSGYLHRAVVGTVSRALDEHPRIPLSVAVSIDGFEREHDAVRGRRGSRARAVRTLEALARMREGHPTLNVGVVLTVNSLDRDRILELYEDVAALGPDSIAANLLRGSGPSLSMEEGDLEAYGLLAERMRRDAYEGRLAGYSNFPGGGLHLAASLVMRDAALGVASGRTGALPCAAGRLNAVIYPDGEVFACETRPDTRLGSLRELGFDIRRLWEGERARAVREAIRGGRCACTHECQLATTVAFDPRYLVRVLAERGRIGLGALGRRPRRAREAR